MLLLGLLFLALAALEVSAGLGKPTLFKNGLHDPLKKIDTLHRAKTVSRSNKVAVPQMCKDWAKDAKCVMDKLEARRVKYDDCDEPWTICRCGYATMSMDTLEARWARVPPGIRSYTGTILATGAKGCSAVNINGQFIRFHGDCSESVFIHEAGHSLDKGMSGSDAFHKAVANSQCVPDDYSNAAYAEDWTQNNVVLTYIKHFGGTVTGLAKHDAKCLAPQFNLIKGDKRIQEAQNAKKCIASKRPFHTKRDLEEYPHALELMPEPSTLDLPVACNFTQPGLSARDVEQFDEHALEAAGIELPFDSETEDAEPVEVDELDYEN
ncbi:hypothetical protein EXIGLDRAFT_773877 [Exidia glandulosa HHB12029]|uniref:Lysine-specific metallo-endopeptidase domain-containing protein n=1 Tax=Exidia glandulosa HHB12029 TaxID=1314781 RepID=A0A165ELJ0_EXIGL|nr:hypothetical protein EXIGLDRAFT_773877 [Exidia glandulosa HHB12029]